MNHSEIPWYRRIRRWGQTNLTEIDPQDYDGDFWRDYWHKTHTQGVIVNAGGIVAYYPSRFKDHYRAAHLGERDLFGEIVRDARDQGLAVLARMDSNRATPDFYAEHPGWFAVNADGQPSLTQGRYQACVNSPYYKEYIPALLGEIIERYHPDAFTDNSWTGLGRHFICHCAYCQDKFLQAANRGLPAKPDWEDETYRLWVRWSYACRLENWDLNNRVTQAAGGEDCLWLGMVNADPVSGSLSFCDLKAVGERSKIVMCDHQSRSALHGFEQNSLNGKMLHSLAGWETVTPESMAHYVRGVRAFRKASNPPIETALWMTTGMAGGISPWWHHIGAQHEDRRQFETSLSFLQWHKDHEEFLYNRKPLARVGLVWSQDNTVFYGQDQALERVALPWRGFTHALTRARIPFLPVNADQIDEQAADLDVLILPGLAAMSDTQCRAVRDYVNKGGSLLLTGNSACLDEWGQARKGCALEEVTGIRTSANPYSLPGSEQTSWEEYEAHTYLRLPTADLRHEMLRSFHNTDILPFGGTLWQPEPAGWLQPLATYIPAFPIYPPEFSWMRQTHSELPVILAGEKPGGGRVVYFAGDIDRCYGRARLPDHGDLLANAVRWAARGPALLQVNGPGYLDCNLYQQENRLILHLTNLSGSNLNPGYVEETTPVGPLTIRVQTKDFIPRRVTLHVAGTALEPNIQNGWATISLDKLTLHEMLVWE